MHMSHTWQGNRYDNAMIGVIVYVVYQAIMEKISASKGMLNLGMNNAIDSISLAKKVMELPLTTSPASWGKTINDMM